MISRRHVPTIALTIYWLGLFTFTHLPPRNVPRMGVGDKVWHFLGYAVLAALLVLSMRRTGGAKTFLVVIAVCLIYGAIDEWTQLLVGRSCELLDWLADASGAIVGTSIALATIRIAGARRAG